LEGNHWAAYYEFSGEILLVGLECKKEQFEQAIKDETTLMSYHYSLNDFLEYFESIATANNRIPLGIEYEEYLKKIKLNYSHLAATVI
jgi:hypothetical protein